MLLVLSGLLWLKSLEKESPNHDEERLILQASGVNLLIGASMAFQQFSKRSVWVLNPRARLIPEAMDISLCLRIAKNS
uniref:Uncharacterized protein n=1 Tax=Kalanchoe fedtschenkoi TaxID=63787 RepID=A0A7N0SZC9_KALFE